MIRNEGDLLGLFFNVPSLVFLRLDQILKNNRVCPVSLVTI